jgi:nucleotide-binding universal stress UspA family protein
MMVITGAGDSAFCTANIMEETVTDDQDQARKPIVVGVDGSPQSVEALRLARRLAELTGCRLKAVTAWQFPVLRSDYPDIDWNRLEGPEQVIAETVTAAFGDDVPADMEKAAVRGQAAHVLVEESRGAEILVVGKRGRGGFRGLRLGSVSSTIAAHAHCPVLITPLEMDAD